MDNLKDLYLEQEFLLRPMLTLAQSHAKTNKRQLLQKIPTVTAKSLWIKQREGRPAE